MSEKNIIKQGIPEKKKQKLVPINERKTSKTENIKNQRR